MHNTQYGIRTDRYMTPINSDRATFVLKWSQSTKIKMTMKFRKISENIVGDIKASVFELDVDEVTQRELHDRLTSKIQAMKIHRELMEDNFLDLLSPSMSDQYKQTIRENFRDLAAPQRHPIVSFDVRRSRVTEFMSQLLLEDSYGCVFHEISDKRINLDFHRADKHVEGIDVTGIAQGQSGLKFVVCEVKATNSSHTPSSSMSALVTDINNAYGDNKSRLAREIADVITKMKESISSQEIKNIVTFLVGVLSERDSGSKYLEKVIFHPFLVKQNTSGVSLDGESEFSPFSDVSYESATVEGVIWSFNADINEFCNTIYEDAIANA